MHVEAVDDVLRGLVAGGKPDRRIDVPFHHLAVEEERRVGVAAAVESGVQRAEADLDLGHDGLVEFGQIAVEPGQHLCQLDHGGGRRQLAGADEVLAVRTRVDPVRVLGHRHVGDEGRLRVGIGGLRAIDHRHLRGAEGLRLALLDRLLDARDVEEDAGVAFGRHHAFVLMAALGVVLVRGGELAVVGGGDEVAVAVDQHLPAHLHGLGIDAREERTVLLGRVRVAPVVGQRRVELGAAENAGGKVDRRIDRVALVRKDAVKALDVGQFGDLVADEIVEADARDAALILSLIQA
jgi:hypothetical protein